MNLSGGRHRSGRSHLALSLAIASYIHVGVNSRLVKSRGPRKINKTYTAREIEDAMYTDSAVYLMLIYKRVGNCCEFVIAQANYSQLNGFRFYIRKFKYRTHYIICIHARLLS